MFYVTPALLAVRCTVKYVPSISRHLKYQKPKLTHLSILLKVYSCKFSVIVWSKWLNTRICVINLLFDIFWWNKEIFVHSFQCFWCEAIFFLNSILISSQLLLNSSHCFVKVEWSTISNALDRSMKRAAQGIYLGQAQWHLKLEMLPIWYDA